MTLIVVVDDQATNRTIYSRMANAIGDDVEVVGFDRPDEALNWLSHNAPDLVLTDFKMPGMDGAEFVREIRAMYLGTDTPVIVITAYADRELRLRALEAGANDFLYSPVDHQEFTTRSRNVLKLGQQQRAVRSWANTLQQELARSEEWIEGSRQRLKQVIDTIPASIRASDQNGRRVFENLHSAALPRNNAQANGQNANGQNANGQDTNGQHVNGQGSNDQVENSRDQQLDQLIFQGKQAMLSYEEEHVDADGRRRAYLTSKFPLFDTDGSVSHVLTTSFDISDRKAAELKMDYLAHHDALTGLPNRRLLLEWLDSALAQSAQDGKPFALHVIDLDRFKSINDGFGHDKGDALLEEVSKRLLHTVAGQGVVARLGGDEFAVLQQVPDGRAEAEGLAERMIEAVSRPFQIESYRATVGASIGLTIAPVDGNTPEQLLKAADLAMYRAKQDGRGRSRSFQIEMQALARDSIVAEIELRNAVTTDEFVLHYQPQVDIKSGRIVGAEALLRWNRPGHGLVSPASFLPLAVETGLIVLIDQLVLRKACEQAAEWARQSSPVVVGVNLSPDTLKARSVLDMVRGVLAETGLSPGLLELELTEGALMQGQHDLAAELQALRQLGVRIAIDDFGTGYSSLAYLQRLPIDRLKIDKTFVEDLLMQVNGSAIVQAVVGIGRSLEMEVLAEGVETLGQLDQVKSDGCSVAQGFLFGQPVSGAEFLNKLQEPRH